MELLDLSINYYVKKVICLQITRLSIDAIIHFPARWAVSPFPYGNINFYSCYDNQCQQGTNSHLRTHSGRPSSIWAS